MKKYICNNCSYAGFLEFRDTHIFDDKCYMCNRIKQWRHSATISQAHQPGKKCKQWNQCRYCSKIRQTRDLIKHLAGVCNPRKCSVCRWPGTVLKEKSADIKKVITDFYILVLKGKVKW